jgi:hypothetical protein
VSEDQGRNDVLRPPNVDILTEAHEGPDEVIGFVDVRDVPGTLEFHCVSSEACKNKEQADTLPATNREMSKRKSLRNVAYMTT